MNELYLNSIENDMWLRVGQKREDKQRKETLGWKEHLIIIFYNLYEIPFYKNKNKLRTHVRHQKISLFR